MTFEQGDADSIYFAEEILAEIDYSRKITVCDRGSGLNIMNELNGYTLCSGIICDDVNGEQYKMIRLKHDEGNDVMHIGYITRTDAIHSELREGYISEVKRVLNDWSQRL